MAAAPVRVHLEEGFRQRCEAPQAPEQHQTRWDLGKARDFGDGRDKHADRRGETVASAVVLLVFLDRVPPEDQVVHLGGGSTVKPEGAQQGRGKEETQEQQLLT